MSPESFATSRSVPPPLRSCRGARVCPNICVGGLARRPRPVGRGLEMITQWHRGADCVRRVVGRHGMVLLRGCRRNHPRSTSVVCRATPAATAARSGSARSTAGAVHCSLAGSDNHSAAPGASGARLPQHRSDLRPDQRVGAGQQLWTRRGRCALVHRKESPTVLVDVSEGVTPAPRRHWPTVDRRGTLRQFSTIASRRELCHRLIWGETCRRSIVVRSGADSGAPSRRSPAVRPSTGGARRW